MVSLGWIITRKLDNYVHTYDVLTTRSDNMWCTKTGQWMQWMTF